MKYRKRPVVIETIKWTGFNEGEIMDFVHGCTQPIEGESLIIPTLEGDMRANLGDWIIKGVNGEFYPVKPDIFEKTYEPATSESLSSEKKYTEEERDKFAINFGTWLIGRAITEGDLEPYKNNVDKK